MVLDLEFQFCESKYNPTKRIKKENILNVDI